MCQLYVIPVALCSEFSGSAEQDNHKTIEDTAKNEDDAGEGYEKNGYYIVRTIRLVKRHPILKIATIIIQYLRGQH